MSIVHSTPVSELPPAPIFRISVQRYHRMIESRVLTEDDRVELLEGWIIEKMPKNRSHAVSTQLTREQLSQVVPPGWHVAAQDPVTTDDSEPEPDVSVIRGDIRDYLDRHPGPLDTALIVEVSDSTLSTDQGIKKRIYARANVPVYWIVNLVDRCIEVYTEPSGSAETPDYGKRQRFAEDDQIPVTIGGQELAHVPVRAMLP